MKLLYYDTPSIETLILSDDPLIDVYIVFCYVL
jgi:hypothetical protein